MKKLEDEILNLIDKELNEHSAIIGINVGTHGGTFVASKFKKNVIKLTDTETAAASSSLLFLSSKMLKGSLNQKISHNLIAGKQTYIISILTENITTISYLSREMADLEGINNYINLLKDLALKIAAIIDTSELIKEEIFVAIKRAIPNTLVIAIITKDGLPIKIQSTMAEPMISAILSALYNLANVLLEEGLEYSIIAGENGSIIIHELDDNRILCVAVPEADEIKLGSYIAKIKQILK
ncbi:MAG: hypothetical protein ACTSQJ_16190 [Promethearchaeota archaeon]